MLLVVAGTQTATSSSSNTKLVVIVGIVVGNCVVGLLCVSWRVLRRRAREAASDVEKVSTARKESTNTDVGLLTGQKESANNDAAPLNGQKQSAVETSEQSTTDG